jgi:beta-glucosidase
MYDHVDVISASVTDSLRAEAIKQAADADLVIYVGGLNKNHLQDCEAGDRLSYELPFGQNDLIKGLLHVNKKMVMVLLSGNAVEMPWVKDVPSIIQGWYLGSETGNAIANIVTGEVNPSGKLPFSFPVKLADNGAHAFGDISYPGDSINQEYKEDILVGYRWHDTKKIPALFPFGHGLSYTTFAYDKATLSSKQMPVEGSLAISLKVKNNGTLAGKEVVQLYVGDEKCSVVRPLKELKKFAKVALNPGEEKLITFTLTPDDLKFYDEASGDWKVENQNEKIKYSRSN